MERLIADGSCWKVLRSHEGGVYAASFRPVADGCAPLLATASFDKVRQSSTLTTVLPGTTLRGRQ